jgi:hypothetical protein
MTIFVSEGMLFVKYYLRFSLYERGYVLEGVPRERNGQVRRNGGRKKEVGWKFEVPKMAIMKIIIFWNVKPCSLVDVCRCFGETCHLHL